MMKSNLLIRNVEEMDIRKILKDGGMKAMSLMNFHLKISYFNIDICIEKDEKKQQEKSRKVIENERRIEEEMNRRYNQDYQYMLYHIIR